MSDEDIWSHWFLGILKLWQADKLKDMDNSAVGNIRGGKDEDLKVWNGSEWIVYIDRKEMKAKFELAE